MTLDGFLVVDKPTGWTSHDVVAKVRRAAGRVRTGHAGTLDPTATGVLVLCLGAGTRLVEWATTHDKRYAAEITLGVETDTYDAAGAVTATHPVDLSADRVTAALAELVGPIEQMPPPYSAVQVGGQRMYDLARQGIAPILAARSVVVHELRLLALELPVLRVDVTCSKGTYIRSLAYDLGRRLGCGAHLSKLRRLASGPFTIELAHPLEAAVAALRAGRGGELLMPLEMGVVGLPRLDLDAIAVDHLRHGRPLIDPPAGSDQVVRVHGPDGTLVAIAESRRGVWWPRKVLPE